MGVKSSVRLHFTVRALERLPVPTDRPAVHHDSETTGLVFKIEPSGHRTFAWSRRVNKRLAWKTIGEFESVTVEQARGKAAEYNASAAKWKQDGCPGTDPFAAPHGITVGDAVRAYVDRYIRMRAKKPDVAARDIIGQLKHHLAAWDARRLSELRHADVADLHEKIGRTHSPWVANRLVQMLRAAVNFCIPKLFSGPNPAAGVALFEEKPRKRFLRDHEFAALATALRRTANRDLADFVIVSLNTGARKSDVLSARWADIDLVHGHWDIPAPKVEPYRVWLMQPVVRVLEARHARAERAAKKKRAPVPQWVFPSRGATGHLRDVRKSWWRLIKAAGVTDLRIHDLRRSLGAKMAQLGAPLLHIQKVLGHQSAATTAKVYAPMMSEAVRPALTAATDSMAAAMAKKPARLLTVAAEPANRRRRA